MLHDAPQFLQALEQSGFASAVRQSSWAYLTANVGHILALAVFAAAVAIMDLRLLGAFSATPPAGVVRPARRVAMLALLLMAATGFVLFAAEATHVAGNGVFQVKAVLIALGVVNALLVARALGPALDATPPCKPLPGRVRAAAALSLGIWLSVAACGRLIAYF
jgi:Family of unknown function (DUF6644)